MLATIQNHIQDRVSSAINAHEHITNKCPLLCTLCMSKPHSLSKQFHNRRYFIFCVEPSDASVPKPSLRSTSSLASLNTPAATTTTGAQQNADEATSEGLAGGDDDIGEDESAFDEAGILFGDSELINSVLLQLLNMSLPCGLLGYTVIKPQKSIIINFLMLTALIIKKVNCIPFCVYIIYTTLSQCS